MSTVPTNTFELHPYGNELRHLEKFCDVIVKVEDRTFPCHRIILASALEYFRSMFCGNYNEAAQKEVVLKGIKAEDFELLLTHIYGGAVLLDESNVYRLLRLSNYVGLETLSNHCEEYIIKQLDVIELGTVVDIFVFASEMEKTTLVNKLAKRLAHDFPFLRKEEKLFHISRTELDEILNHLDLVRNRIVILDFVVQWSKYHPAEVDMLNDLSNQLELPSDLRGWFLKTLKETPVYANNEDENVAGNAQSIVAGENGDIFYNESTNGNETAIIQSRRMKSPTFTLLCSACRSNGSTEYPSYFVSEYKYNTKFQGIQPVNKHQQYFLNDRFYRLQFYRAILIHGVQFHCVSLAHTKTPSKILLKMISSSRTEDLASYECSTIDSPSQLAPCGTKIYFYNDNEFLMFNAEVGRWTHLNGDEPPRTRDANLISYQNNLYMLGGTHATTHLSTICKKSHAIENGKIFQRYDPREGTWSQLSNMTYGHSSFASCVHKDILYATGGECLSYDGGLMDCYDFKADKWLALEARMPKQKKNHIVFGYDDQLYFFGPDFSWYWYNIKEETWSDVSLIPRKYSSCCITRILDAGMRI